MGALAWMMMAIAIWHFTVFLPDRFWGGIVGAFVASVVGAMVFGLMTNGFGIPGTTETHILQAVEAIPGTIVGLAVCYWIGVRREASDHDAE